MIAKVGSIDTMRAQEKMDPRKPPTHEDPRTLIDALLAEQRSLTAVDRFSRRHSEEEFPAHAKFYRDLLPLNSPAPGQQYAFEVDLDRCTGCKGCVTACHSLNGLDDDEAWRNIGLLHLPSASRPFQQTVTTACHHCADPACSNGCPVLAYEKDEVTGIVRHLDDQCIGCQYCVLKCPYDVPKYNPRLGIVRKCDMCTARLAVGEAPACVQACPNKAIRITLVSKQDLKKQFRERSEAAFLQGTVDPSYTVPTTQFLSSRSYVAECEAGDHHHLQPEPPHWPLVLMLALTQMSVGTMLVQAGLGASNPIPSWFALGSCLAGLVSSLCHLGRPLLAWKAFLGWKRSWLSREIIAFGMYAPALILFTLLTPISNWLRIEEVAPALQAAVVVTGLAGVLASAMIYIDTRRPFWNASNTGIRFFGTTFILGAVCNLFSFTDQKTSLALLMACGTIKLLLELRFLRHSDDSLLTHETKSALLLVDPLQKPLRLRMALAVLGYIVIPAILLLSAKASMFAVVMLLFLVLAAEIAERYLFFRAVVPWKMPGGYTA